MTVKPNSPSSSHPPHPQDPVDICDKGSNCGCGLHNEGAQEDPSCCKELVLNIPTPTCSKSTCAKRTRSYFPVLDWAPKYGLSDLQGDAIAGITVALTVIPQGLAYAGVAGLPPQYGLYSAFMGCFVYVFLGTAKDITFGPTAIMSLMVGQFGRGDPGLAVTMTLVAGLLQFLMGLLNLGVLISFISFPVISAFTSAAAVTIATTQLKSLLGLKGIPNEFLHAIEKIIEKIKYTLYGDLTLGLICIVVLYVMKRVKGLKWTDAAVSSSSSSLSFCSRLTRRAVWLLCTARNAIVVLVAATVCYFLETRSADFSFWQISLTPDVDAGMPPVRPPQFVVDINGTSVQALSEVGVGYAVVALVGILESIAIGKAFARIGNYKVRPSQEMIAMGVANVVSSFFSSFPVTGSFSRTAVNYQTGVKTPFGGVFTGAVVLLALGFLAPMFKYIPKAALAAVIISSVIPMFDTDILLKFWRVVFLGHLPSSPTGLFLHHLAIDVLPWLGTFFGCLFLGLEYGILIGVGISILPLLWLVAKPPVTTTDDATSVASNENSMVAILTPQFGLSFPAAEEFAETASNAANIPVDLEMEEDEDEEDDDPNLSPVGRDSRRWLSVKTKPRSAASATVATTRSQAPELARRHLILDCSRIVTLDFSVIQMLAELNAEQKRHDRLLVFCHLDSRNMALLDNGLIVPFNACPDVGRALELIDRFQSDARTLELPLQ